MKRSAYIRQLLPALGANLAGMAAISLFLLAVGNSIGTVEVILAVQSSLFYMANCIFGHAVVNWKNFYKKPMHLNSGI